MKANNILCTDFRVDNSILYLELQETSAEEIENTNWDSILIETDQGDHVNSFENFLIQSVTKYLNEEKWTVAFQYIQDPTYQKLISVEQQLAAQQETIDRLLSLLDNE